MTLNEFKDWSLAQGTVAKTDGGFAGECVSLINQYCSKVLGFEAGAWGNAKDWPTNGNVLNNFDRVGSPQPGDVGVSGATATNPYGHIWIYLDNNQILEQNGRIARRVTVSPMRSGIVLRPKNQSNIGGNMAERASLGTARILTERILGRDYAATHAGASDGDLNANHVGRELTNAYIFELWTSPEGSAYSQYKQASTAFYTKYKDVIADLQARPTKDQLATAQAQLAEEAKKVEAAQKALEEAKAKSTEDTQILDNAGSWLTKLFNRLFKKG